MAHEPKNAAQPSPTDPAALAQRVAELEARVEFLERTLRETLDELSRIAMADAFA